jgi:hypothetical protein
LDVLINRRIEIHWTQPALDEVLSERFMNDPRYGGDPKGWHERRVYAYTQQHGINKQQRVNIRYAYIPCISPIIYILLHQRKPAHCGGTHDPDEKEHITVSFKKENPEGRHIYTIDMEGLL